MAMVLKIEALMRVVYEYLIVQADLMALLPGGVHDPTAQFYPPGPPVKVAYPYLVLTIVDIADNSSFTGTASGWLRLQTDLYDESDSPVNIGEASKILNEVLDKRTMVDAHGEYHPITLVAAVARPVDQEEGKVWRISQDFTGQIDRTT